MRSTLPAFGRHGHHTRLPGRLGENETAGTGRRDRGFFACSKFIQRAVAGIRLFKTAVRGSRHIAAACHTDTKVDTKGNAVDGRDRSADTYA